FTLFRRRFPWLIATLMGGLLTAAIADAYYDVASQARVVPFIPLVLALASSVTAQSVSLAVQTLRGQLPSWAALVTKVRYELATGSLLGLACGLVAGMAIFLGKGDPVAALSLLASIVVSAACGALIGLAMPYLFRTFESKSHVAAGPVALASADALTLLVYF